MVVDGTAFRYTMVEPGRRQIMASYIPGDIPDLEGLFLKTMDHSLGVLRSCTIAQFRMMQSWAFSRSNPGWAKSSGGRRSLIRCDAKVVGLCRPSLTNELHRTYDLRVRRPNAGCRSVGRGDMRFPMTQTELGDAAGLSTVHINRTLRDLRKLGLVTWGIHSVTIHDWAGLARSDSSIPLICSCRARTSPTTTGGRR